MSPAIVYAVAEFDDAFNNRTILLVDHQAGPGSLKKPHTWRTRSDPLSGIWSEAERWLEESPEVEAKALFEYLLATLARAYDSMLATVGWLGKTRNPM